MINEFTLLLCLIGILIWSVALVSIANGSFYDNTTKLCWLLIVLVLNIAGVLLFLFFGRREVNFGNRMTKT